MSVYPRAAAPVTQFAYRMALARAERWRKRYETAAAELATVRTFIDTHRCEWACEDTLAAALNTNQPTGDQP